MTARKVWAGLPGAPRNLNVTEIWFDATTEPVRLLLTTDSMLLPSLFVADGIGDLRLTLRWVTDIQGQALFEVTAPRPDDTPDPASPLPLVRLCGPYLKRTVTDAPRSNFGHLDISSAASGPRR